MGMIRFEDVSVNTELVTHVTRPDSDSVRVHLASGESVTLEGPAGKAAWLYFGGRQTEIPGGVNESGQSW